MASCRDCKHLVPDKIRPDGKPDSSNWQCAVLGIKGINAGSSCRDKTKFEKK